MKAKIIRVQVNQSLFDIAIQEYGSAEGVFLIMLANRDVVPNITADIDPGTVLKVWPVKVVRQVVEQTESLAPFLPVIMQWLSMIGSVGNGGALDPTDFVHIRGDEIISGIKSFTDQIRTNHINDLANEGIMIEGVRIYNGVIDEGTW